MVEILQLLMIGRWNRGEEAGWGKVSKSGYIVQKLVGRSTCRESLAKIAAMWRGQVLHHSDNLDSVWSEIHRPQSFWMQMKIHRNTILVVNNDYMVCCIQLLRVPSPFPTVYCERQQIINYVWLYTFGYQRAALSHPSKVNVLVSFIAERASNLLVDPSQRCAPTERSQFLALYVG